MPNWRRGVGDLPRPPACRIRLGSPSGASDLARLGGAELRPRRPWALVLSVAEPEEPGECWLVGRPLVAFVAAKKVKEKMGER